MYLILYDSDKNALRCNILIETRNIENIYNNQGGQRGWTVFRVWKAFFNLMHAQNLWIASQNIVITNSYHRQKVIIRPGSRKKKFFF